VAEDLIEQQRKQQEASQALTQESVNAYMDFLNSVFARPREGSRPPGVPHGRRIPNGTLSPVGKRMLPRTRPFATR